MSTSPHTYAALKARVAGTPAKANPGKIPHRKVMLDGYVFDSVAECERYKELRLLEKAGHIRNIHVHPTFEFRVNGILVATYTADTEYQELTEWGGFRAQIVEDVKSLWTRKNREYRRNRKLMEALYNITIREVLK